MPGGHRHGIGDPAPKRSWSLDHDAHTLDLEVLTIRRVWKDVPIVVVGHSQGGLVALDEWCCTTSSGLRLQRVSHLFSLDSPINGACVRVHGTCLGAAGYPRYDDRVAADRDLLRRDRARGWPFRFIGTWGDSVPITLHAELPGGRVEVRAHGYGVGDDTLQHQLLVGHGRCVGPRNRAGCPPPPDQISSYPSGRASDCRIPGSAWIADDQQFIVKFCPGNVDRFNRVLALRY